ncbi:MFS transporter [Nocardia wallacei]|uniref:MFS transporter n=1 Tax=Nocardia wallacei TaxID=480035 RepID=UPI002458F4C3|nr:MFS transporter [Nocardia wallacei]
MPSTSTSPTGRRLGLTLALLAFAQLIYALDLNIVFVALPEIGKDLGFPGQTQQLVVSVYVVFAGGFLLLGGRAADLLGRRRMFVLALLLYGISSLAGAMATGPAVIIAARAVQGIGGALLLPATLALINTQFEEGSKRNRALAVWGGAGASGLTIGALLGGILTEQFGWPAVFFVNVPLAAIVVVGALLVIPRDPVATQRRSFDLPGAFSVTAGSTILVFALVEGPELGWASPVVGGAFPAAVLLLAAFAVIEARTADPIMPFRLFRNRSLTVGMVVTFLYMATFGVLPYFLTVLLQSVHGYSALQTGLAFLVPSLAIATGTQLGERLATRIGNRATLLIGFALGAAGTVVWHWVSARRPATASSSRAWWSPVSARASSGPPCGSPPPPVPPRTSRAWPMASPPPRSISEMPSAWRYSRWSPIWASTASPAPTCSPPWPTVSGWWCC